jgi:ABC-2 type transport system permease protein
MTRVLSSPVSLKLPTTRNHDLADFLQETTALTKRLFIQLYRRPSTLIAGLVQPLMWLILFGALFQNAPAIFLGEGTSYSQFVGAGIIVFTAFGGALNAGLPVMFDREFGFLNRLLVAPLVSRFSIVAASALFITTMSLVQTLLIIGVNAMLGTHLPNFAALGLVLAIILMLVVAVTAISLGLAFALTGHIELIAVIFVLNLPLLFASTALAPLSFMPPWLQTIACLNPLSYAIEPIRYVYRHADWQFSSSVLQAPWGAIDIGQCLLILLIVNILVLLGIQPLLQRKLA